MNLPDTAWRARVGLPELLKALGGAAGDTRFVGGFVRDSLLGAPPADIDLATRLPPDDVVSRVRAAGFKPVPTGIAHGTVTAVLPSGPIEVTTLRRDLATDGRHAIVAFTDDWRADAARRDFTINALFADPRDGSILDHFDGVADLLARRVRFIGDPLRRIAEDHLRILRFFRFHARFGEGAPDPAGLDACADRARDLMTLSRERIADELVKLLTLPRPALTVRTMIAHGVLAPVLPEIDAAGVARLVTLDEKTDLAGIAPDPFRRMAALLPADPALAGAVAARLKLSNAKRKRLEAATGPEAVSPDGARALAYRLGIVAAQDRILLSPLDREATAQALNALAGWTRPRLPVSGGDLVALGLRPGPLVAARLAAIEAAWIAEGFPGPDRTRVLAQAIAASQ